MQVPEDRAKQTSLKVQRKALLFWLQKRTAARIKRSNIGFKKQTPTGNCQNMLHLVINYNCLSSSIWKWQILLISNSQWLNLPNQNSKSLPFETYTPNLIISPNIWSKLDTSPPEHAFKAEITPIKRYLDLKYTMRKVRKDKKCYSIVIDVAMLGCPRKLENG